MYIFQAAAAAAVVAAADVAACLPKNARAPIGIPNYERNICIESLDVLDVGEKRINAKLSLCLEHLASLLHIRRVTMPFYGHCQVIDSLLASK